MTNETYKKANNIQNKIKELKNLKKLIIWKKRKMRFLRTIKGFFISDYLMDSVYLCDIKLAEIIQEYCDKRIEELREELESL